MVTKLNLKTNYDSNGQIIPNSQHNEILSE